MSTQLEVEDRVAENTRVKILDGDCKKGVEMVFIFQLALIVT